MELTALVLYLVWAGLAFGWKTIDQRRRTGDTGLRLHAEPNTAQWWAKIAFITAIGTGLVAPITAMAGLDNLGPLDADWIHVVGIAVTATGIAATLAAQSAMGNSWRIGVDGQERTELVTHGVFRLARNPIFTAMVVTAIGLAMIVPNIVSVIGLASLVAALEVQVRLVEEPYLRRTHGESYRHYARRVGRFTPRIGRIA